MALNCNFMEIFASIAGKTVADLEYAIVAVLRIVCDSVILEATSAWTFSRLQMAGFRQNPVEVTLHHFLFVDRPQPHPHRTRGAPCAIPNEFEQNVDRLPHIYSAIAIAKPDLAKSALGRASGMANLH